ncbi:MAG: peptide ABC transporter substrate-binding protein [bacterium]
MKMKKKKLASLFLASIMAMSTLVGCGSSSSGDSSSSSSESSSSVNSSSDNQATPVSSQEITFALQNQYDNIDPGITINSFANPFMVNLFEGLVAYDVDNNLVEGCAESWEISDDGLTYTFTLRDGLKWSNGDDLTSEDFLYSYQRVLTPSTASQFGFIMTDYIYNAQEFTDGLVGADELGISAPDEKTLVIQLKNVTPFFLDILAISAYYPVHQGIVEANPDTWTLKADTYISNGPFMLDSLQFGENARLVKNPYYHDADAVSLEALNLRFILEPSTALSAFESGEIQGSNTVPPADMTRLRSDSNSGLQMASTFGLTYYVFNCLEEPLDDPKVRQALSLAIDRTAIIDNVLQTTDEPATSLIPPGYIVDGVDFADGRSDFNIKPNANIELAQELLAEAGYPNGEGFPTLRLGYYSDTVVKKVTEAMQQMWKDNLNIDTNIEVADWAVFYTDLQADDFDIGALGKSADFLNPLSFLLTAESSNLLNIPNYRNPDYDEVFAEAMVTSDPDKAIQLMREAETILMEDMSVLPLYYRTKTYMLSTNIEGFNYSPLGIPHFKYVKVN